MLARLLAAKGAIMNISSARVAIPSSQQEIVRADALSGTLFSLAPGSANVGCDADAGTVQVPLRIAPSVLTLGR